MENIVLIGGEKGGTGKSTIAQNLAAYLKLIKGLDVMLLDSDPQQTTSSWIDARNKTDLPTIHCVSKTGNLAQLLKELSLKYEAVVVDTAGCDDEPSRSAMTVVKNMIIPLRPKRRDLKTLLQMEHLVRLARSLNDQLQPRVLFSQCPNLPSQATRIQEAREACEAFGLSHLSNMSMQRNVYDDCEEYGQSVFEASDNKAILEFTKIGEEIWG